MLLVYDEEGVVCSFNVSCPSGSVRQGDNYPPDARQPQQQRGRVEIAPRFWGLVVDKEYYGVAENRHERLVPWKGDLTPDKEEFNRQLGLIRVRIEQFFGLRTKLWTLTAQTYPYAEKHVQLDMTNVILLTNEVKMDRAILMSEELGLYYRGFLNMLIERRRKFLDKKHHIHEEVEENDAPV